MPKPFYSLTLEEFTSLLHQYPFKRRINAVHLHHTLRPNQEQYNGMASIEAMWRFQTQNKGLSDLAQHLTIAPDGKIWTGRNWDQPPVSAAGHNGNAVAGPFMISVVGDFNEGGDSFSGDQREVTLQIIALVQQLFRLPVDSLQFHSQMSLQSCPGSSIKYAEIKSAVSKIHTKLKQGKSKSDGRKGVEKSPFGPEAQEGSDQIQKIIEAISLDVSGRGDPPDTELNDDERTDEEIQLLTGQESVVLPAPGQPKQTRQARAACDPTLPEVRSALRPHVINLNQGQFSGSGQYTTQPGDVDAIFGEHLEQAMAEAKKKKKKLKLLFYAHGGLVNEADGLCAAYKQIPWWLDNQVYPLYFVWETGFFETIGQLLFGARQRAGISRDIYDFTTDPIIEATVRRLGGVQIWAGMKRSAEQAVRTPSDGTASFDGGGAYYVAEKLKAFCDKHEEDGVELYGIGHSAGSIFHAHFLPTALDLGVPPFQSVHLLAPAIRTDEFSRLLAGRVGHGIDHVTIFTMAKDWELADNCANIYHKSLLYLLYYGLESQRKTPILGLEESLRADASLAALFGLNGHSSKVGEVIWAKSAVTSGRSATASTSHGGFDDDPATMNSVLRRILGLNDTVQITGYPAAASRDVTNLWGDFTRPLVEGSMYWVPAEPTTAPAPVQPQPAPVSPAASLPASVPTAGRRRALCIGIDTYRTSPLNGCVADAQAWTDTFRRLNFQVTLLRNDEATHDSILKALSDLVESSLPGDVVAFQYAGHGTQVRDLDQDEQAGDSPQMDEAICPVDYDQGRLIIDDDIAAIFARIPDGVNVTCFMDCCHSGTISRFGIGVPEQDNGVNLNEKPRYIVADAALEEAYRRFRAGQPKFRAAGTRGPSTMKEVLFSACRSNEVAWESNGHGDFTTRATPILNAGLAGLTHDVFKQRVSEAFGAAPRQHPELDCAPAARERPLLQPLTGQIPLSPTPVVSAGAGQNGVDGLAAIAQGLKLLADLLTHRS